ncbi:hypothetical protein SDRG_11106 [Saprolegnia diclina VS20]|uniref:Uncharacterized protein n=1 Tax=Saprolegnia diclina (strain VS20) TaxID=1156394 RepID=T0QC90_SAPDV|nr:hypothetical protein SDRG_11106 [Saprolegnia diclina VS20]EQC31180.1 hypothetical protein SDRG_11106 [Saprolegnia diclina VS20]|eukprot:XP_008615353.1 hypothetical protein SDRG_11106 [Saprolegnia diclina VS20]
MTTENEALFKAAQDGSVDDVRRLLAAGADASVRFGGSRMTPLCAAAANGHVSVVEVLVQAGADIFQGNAKSELPRTLAENKGHANVVAAIDQAIDWRVRLLKALVANDVPAALALLAENKGPAHIKYWPFELPVNISLTEYGTYELGDGAIARGITALHIPAAHGVDELVAALLDRPDIQVGNFGVGQHNVMPLHMAARNGHANVVSRLLAAKAQVNFIGHNGWTPLHWAAMHGHANVVSLLLAAGAAIDCQDEANATPLFLAAKAGHTSVVQALIEANADAQLTNESSESPRSIAATGGHTAVVALLDTVLPPPTLAVAVPETTHPMSEAIRDGDVTKVAELLRGGADPNARYERGPALSPSPSSKAGVGISFLLVNAKAHINDDSSLLHVAAAHGAEAITALLLASPGLLIDPLDSMGNTPLSLAAAHGHAAVVLQLLKAKANIQSVTQAKETPLHVAVTRGHVPVVELLLDAGASVDAENSDNKTPWTLAQELDNPDLLTVFRTKKGLSSLSKAASEIHDTPVEATNDFLAAVQAGHIHQLQQLLVANPNHNVIQDETGDSLLHVAAKGDHIGILRMLLLQTPAISPQLRNKSLESALHIAIKRRNLHTTQALHYAARWMTHCVAANAIAINREVALGESKCNIIYQGEFNGDAVAVKTALFPSQAPGLICEIEALQRCDSPYLTRLLAVADHDTACPKLVFDYMGVGNLRMYLDKKRDATMRDDEALVQAANDGSLEELQRLLRDKIDVNVVQNGRTSLHAAAANGHVEVVRVLLAAEADPFRTNDHHQLPRDVAAERGHSAVVTCLNTAMEQLSGFFQALYDVDEATILRLLENNVPVSVPYTSTLALRQSTPSHSDTGDDDNETTDGMLPLHLASISGSEVVVAALLARPRIDVNAVGRHPWRSTALHLAATNDGVGIVVTLLLAAGAAVNAVNFVGCTPLHHAASTGNVPVAQALLEAKATVDARDKDQSTPLHVGVAHTSIVALLIAANAVVHALDKGECAPLHLAAHHGNVGAVQQLLDANAQVDARHQRGCTPLHFAASAGHAPVVSLLLSKNAIVDAVAKSDSTPLLLAAKHGHVQATALLLAAKASVDVYTLDTWTPLHHAAANGHAEVVQLLLQAKADVKAYDKQHFTPWHLAVLQGHASVVTVMLAASVPVNHRCQDYTALHLAAQQGHASVITVLLAAKASVHARATAPSTHQHSNSRPLHRITPLHVAANKGHGLAVALLLAANAPVNDRSSDGSTPLLYAAAYGHVDVVQLLLDVQADVNIATELGWTGLHVAAANGHTNVVRMLLGAHFSVNARGKHDGVTPLFLAAEAGCADIVQLLLDASANPTLATKNGDTPRSVAKANGYTAVVEALDAYVNPAPVNEVLL